MTLDPQSSRSLYAQLADVLRSAIQRGELQPGQRLPSERELEETYGVSRATVKLALSALKAEALVVSGHGRGTFVRITPAVRLESHRYGADRPRFGPFKAGADRAGMSGEVRLTAVERQSADADLAYRLGIEEGAPVIMRGRHMLADGRLLQLFDAFYPADLFEGTELEAPELASGGIYGALTRLGFTPDRAHEEVSARAATVEETRLLNLAPGVPVLVISRMTYDVSGRALEASDLIASADANVLIYDLPLR
ncbi:MAG: GntR family transcriptional regulator [Egibacteraceae bacterium]